jgi:hypothetical protein
MAEAPPLLWGGFRVSTGWWNEIQPACGIDAGFENYGRVVKPIRLKSFRKEVIQPQVPLRLPCYDLVPITGFTLGACLSCELAQRR